MEAEAKRLPTRMSMQPLRVERNGKTYVFAYGYARFIGLEPPNAMRAPTILVLGGSTAKHLPRGGAGYDMGKMACKIVLCSDPERVAVMVCDEETTSMFDNETGELLQVAEQLRWQVKDGVATVELIEIWRAKKRSDGTLCNRDLNACRNISDRFESSKIIRLAATRAPESERVCDVRELDAR